MRIAYWILLMLYLALVFLYGQAPPSVATVTPWPLLDPVAPEATALPASCRMSADCPAHHACLQHACVPHLLRGGACDAATGEWRVHLYRGVPFAVCTCTRPEIYGQKYFGGNCEVSVACGLHGRWDPVSETCACDPGYRPGPGHTCERAPAVERQAAGPCGPGEIEVEHIRPEDGFHPDYLETLKGVKCVRRPCTFDALSERPLQHGSFLPNWGCLCDPRYGLFGVSLEGEGKKYLQTPGPDACASIYEKHELWTEVVLRTFYYLDQRPPLSFIEFRFVPTHLLPPLLLVHPGLVHPVFQAHAFFLQSPFQDLVKDNGLVVGQQWPHTYMQHVLDHERLAVRTRECRLNPWWFNAETCDEEIIEHPYRRIPCDRIERTRPAYGGDNAHVKAYREMYRYPICLLSPSDRHPDPNADSIFSGKNILNPFLLTYAEQPLLFRTNEMVMTFSREYQSWRVDFGDGYRVDDYRRMQTNAPVVIPSAKKDEKNPLEHVLRVEV